MQTIAMQRQGNFGPLHEQLMKQGSNSILLIKPKARETSVMDPVKDRTLPHLSPRHNPLLQMALSPVSRMITFLIIISASSCLA